MKGMHFLTHMNFNSRPSARGDFTFPIVQILNSYFNSRPSARGDIAAMLGNMCRESFQFTPLREGRQVCHTAHKDGAYFNSRPSARGDTPPRACHASRHKISIHAPPRGATVARLRVFGAAVNFNSRPSARGDQLDSTALCARNLFQFTPLREGRQVRLTAEPSDIPFQFTPLREGRLPRLKVCIHQDCISIHAPPRGATGVDYRLQKIRLFQFTPLREGRHLCKRKIAQLRRISIHAPPRGATWSHCITALYAADFNSRPSARGDERAACRKQRTGDYFNSRPSARGDACVMHKQCAVCDFNSRPSARGDAVIVKQIRNHLGISIHAPPRGAT